jgi:hypothetical protein
MVTQVSLDGIFYFGAKVRLEMLLIIYCFRSKDDLMAHSGQIIARLDLKIKKPSWLDA